MTPSEMETAASQIYGRTRWKQRLATDLGVNVCTIHRMMHRPVVSPVYAVAITAILKQRSPNPPMPFGLRRDKQMGDLE